MNNSNYNHYHSLSNEASYQLAKEDIQTALILLMHEKDFEKITISELVNRSGVSRSTFYRHYKSKEEIIQQMLDDFLIEIRESFDACDENKIYDWLKALFDLAREYASVIQLLLKANYPKQTLYPILSFEYRFPSHDAKQHYRSIALESALSSVLFAWFDDGMKESSEIMATYCYRFYLRIK